MIKVYNTQEDIASGFAKFLQIADPDIRKTQLNIIPYILFGIGVTVAPGNETFTSLNIPLGIGAKYKVANRLNLGLEFSFRKLFGDSFDVTDGNNAFLDNPYEISGSAFKNKDWYSLLMFSVTWDFGLRCRTCNNRYSSGSF